MKICYAVQWIEVEFGQRDEGFALFVDLEKCIVSTKESSERGSSPEGYFGPVRSLQYIEVPFDSLEKELQDKLNEKGTAHTGNRWRPKFTSLPCRIE